MSRKILNNIINIFYLLAGSEAVFFTINLLLLPTDPKTAWIGKFSRPRILLGTIFLASFFVFVLMAYLSRNESKRTSNFVTNFMLKKHHIQGIISLSIFLLCLGFIITIVKPAIWFLQTGEAYYRIQPAINWIMLLLSQITIGALLIVILNNWGRLIKALCWLTWSNIALSLHRYSWKQIIPWILIGMIGLGTTFYYQGSHSPWVKLGVPFTTAHINNPIYGYNIIYNADFHNKENFYSFRQMDMMKGNEVFSPIFSDKRIFYAFLGNIYTLIFNSYYAFLFLNFTLFFVSAILLYLFTDTLFHNKNKSLLASFLFSLSISMVTHMGDTSPHILAIFFYFLWALLLLKLIIRDQPITLKEFIGLLTILSLWSLTYPGSFYGLIIFLLVLIKEKKYLYLIFPILVFYLVPSLQINIISSLHSLPIRGGITQIGGKPGMVEISMVQNMVYLHINGFLASPVSYIQLLFTTFIDLLFIDNPLFVLISAIGILFLKNKEKWYLYLVLFVPILTSLFFFRQSSTRGYMAAGAIIIVFAITSHYIIEWATILQKKIGSLAAIILLIIVLGIQAGWAHASAFNILLPAYSYGFGLSRTLGSLNMTRFVRYTGNLNEKPELLYGSEQVNKYLGEPMNTGKQALFPHERILFKSQSLRHLRQTFINLLIGLYVQSLMIFLVLLLIFIYSRVSIRFYSILLMCLLVLATQLFSDSTGLDKSSYINIDRTMALSPGEEVRGNIRLSDDFIHMIEQYGGDHKVVFYLSYLTNNGGFKIYDTTSLEKNTLPRFITMNLDEFRTILNQHNNVLSFSIFNGKTEDSELLFGSWQKNLSDEGRYVEKMNADGSMIPIEWFPNLEIRIMGDPINYGYTTLPSINLIGY